MLHARTALALALSIHAISAPALASNVPPAVSPAEAMQGILRQAQSAAEDGIVTSETVSLSGQDFFQYFIHAWRDQEGHERYTLALREQVSARAGNEIRIQYRFDSVLRLRLPNSRLELKRMAEEAASNCYQAVQQSQADRSIRNEIDLAGDEL